MKRHTIYFLGGPARVGKTTISTKIMRQGRVVVVSTDSIRSMIRNVLTGMSGIAVEKINFRGDATFHKPGNLKVHKIKFVEKDKTEDDFTWKGVVGLINSYDQKNKMDILIEGIAITPERVHRLKLKNLSVKAAFVGYNKPSHFDTIMAYSKKKKDWVQVWIKEHGGSDAHVRDWVKKEIVRSAKVEKICKKYGYGYFDITNYPFEKYVGEVVKYLQKPSTPLH